MLATIKVAVVMLLRVLIEHSIRPREGRQRVIRENREQSHKMCPRRFHLMAICRDNAYIHFYV